MTIEFMPTIRTNLDIRDIEAGQTYFVVTDETTGRCVNSGQFRAAFLTQQEAREFAQSLGPNYKAVKTWKSV